MRVVLDTNIIVSGFGWRGNERSVTRSTISGKLHLILSPDIIAEYRRSLGYKKLGFDKEEIESYVDSLVEVASVVFPLSKVSFCKGESDNKFIEAAIEGKAKYIVSGDKHLLSLKKVGKIKIVTASDFSALHLKKY